MGPGRRLMRGLQEPTLGTLEHEAGQAAGPARAGIDANPIDPSGGRFLNRVTVHHDLAAVAAPAEKRFADPEQVSFALLGQRDLRADPCVTEEIVTEAERQLEIVQERSMLGGEALLQL